MRRALLACVLAACGHPPAPQSAGIQIWVETPGNPLDLERYVTVPIETAMTALPGATGVHSMTAVGRVVVTVDVTGDVLAARHAIIDRLRDAVLPTSVAASLGPLTSHDGALLRYVVRGAASPVDARRLEDWTIAPALLRLAGVADVSTCGGLVEEAHVAVNGDGMLGVSLHDVVRTITENLPLMHAHLGFGDFAPLVMRTVNGAPIRIGDVATISRGHAPHTCVVVDELDADAVEGAVWIRPNADRAALRTTVSAALAAMKLPPGVELAIVPDAARAAIALPAAPREDQLRMLATLRAPDVHATLELGDDDGDVDATVPDEVRVRVASSADLPAVANRVKNLAGARWIDDTPTAWIRLSGPDLDVLRKLAANVPWDVVERVGTETIPTKRFEIDRKRSAELGVSIADADEAVAASIGALDAGTMHEDGRAIAIVISTSAPVVATATGTSAPLDAISVLRVAPEPRTILRDGGVHCVGVRVSVHDRDALTAEVRALRLPVGYTASIND